jgi:hypothetical protein
LRSLPLDRLSEPVGEVRGRNCRHAVEVTADERRRRPLRGLRQVWT